MNHERYMLRCIELASNGLGKVAPNPMVGAVVVHGEDIIGEGFHQKYGDAHAEVNAIKAVKDKTLLSNSTLYVSLEPCNHFGKTPPCTELILSSKIPRVFIGSKDSNSTVKGNGIEMLQNKGVEVIFGILEKECKELNKRFFYFNEHKRPYVILKWAQSADGFIGHELHGNHPISNEYSRQLVHKWRCEDAAILVGTTTAAIDNPNLTVRDYSGKNPLRLVIDWENKLASDLNLFDRKTPTLVFTRKAKKSLENLEYVEISASLNELDNILQVLAEKKVQSLLVEGGSKLLQSFIDTGNWNEARVFTSDIICSHGVKSPILRENQIACSTIKNDTLVVHKNDKSNE